MNHAKAISSCVRQNQDHCRQIIDKIRQIYNSGEPATNTDLVYVLEEVNHLLDINLQLLEQADVLAQKDL